MAEEKNEGLKTQKLDTKAQTMKELLASQKRVPILIPKDNSKITNRVKIDGKFYDSLGEPQYFCINGYNYYVPKGTPVDVPESIAKLYLQSCRHKEMTVRRLTQAEDGPGRTTKYDS